MVARDHTASRRDQLCWFMRLFFGRMFTKDQEAAERDSLASETVCPSGPPVLKVGRIMLSALWVRKRRRWIPIYKDISFHRCRAQETCPHLFRLHSSLSLQEWVLLIVTLNLQPQPVSLAQSWCQQSPRGLGQSDSGPGCLATGLLSHEARKDLWLPGDAYGGCGLKEGDLLQTRTL